MYIQQSIYVTRNNELRCVPSSVVVSLLMLGWNILVRSKNK